MSDTQGVLHARRYAAEQLWGVTVPPGPLPLRTVRNADFKEVTLEVGGRTVLRFATAYGFRNIQTLMRQMKRGRCEYDYVEIMACPSGAAPSQQAPHVHPKALKPRRCGPRSGAAFHSGNHASSQP